MKWHELNRVIGNTYNTVSRWAKSCFAWKVSFREYGEYPGKLWSIQWKSFTKTQYNDLLRQITSSSSSYNSSRSLFFGWQRYIAGMVFFFGSFLIFYTYKILYTLHRICHFLPSNSGVCVCTTSAACIFYIEALSIPKFTF